MSSLFSNRAPDGACLLTLFLGGAQFPERTALSEEDILKNALHDMRHLLGIQTPPLFHKTIFHPQSIPQYNLGFGAILESMKTIESKLPGLFFAGPCRDGISVGNAICSAQKVASHILKVRP